MSEKLDKMSVNSVDTTGGDNAVPHRYFCDVRPNVAAPISTAHIANGEAAVAAVVSAVATAGGIAAGSASAAFVLMRAL